VIATITNEADGYAAELYDRLRSQGVRVELDTRNETINLKVREHSLAKVSTLFVVGARERDEKTVAIRRLGSNGQEIQSADQAVAALVEAARSPF
jgi:threonyl-tRNA synthetase